MSTTEPRSTPIHENQKVLRIAGGVLFALGLLSFALVYTADAATTEAIRLAAGTGLLVGMGYAAVLYTDARKRIAELEARVVDLEQRAKNGG